MVSTILKRSSGWLTLDENLTSVKRKRRLLLSKWWSSSRSRCNYCCMSVWNLCPFRMDICRMGICVHSKWTYVYSEWTYVGWEFVSIPNGHMSDWNLCPFRMDMYVRLES